MKKFVFIYTLSLILCLSPFISADEMPSAIENSISGTEGEIAVDAGNVTGSAVELPSGADNCGDSSEPGDLTTNSAILIPSDGTTGSGIILIPEECVPGGTGRTTSPPAITTTEAGIATSPTAISITGSGIMTTTEAIMPADITELELLAAQAAAAGTGSYMVLTVAPASYDMGILNSGNIYTYTGAVVLSVSTKSVWNLQVSGTDFSNGTFTIPVSRIKCKVSTSSEYKTLSSTPLDLLTSQSKAWPQTRTVQIDYQITILTTDPAGANFQNNLTFTLY